MVFTPAVHASLQSSVDGDWLWSVYGSEVCVYVYVYVILFICVYVLFFLYVPFFTRKAVG